METFKQKVLGVVNKIAKGEVLSYGEVAKRAGGLGLASRAVGTIMAKNQDKNIPCHRVVKSDGSIGEYNGLRTKTTGKSAKQKILESEGVKFNKSGKIIFK